jgi:hypothetical protein
MNIKQPPELQYKSVIGHVKQAKNLMQQDEKITCHGV